MNKPFQFPRRIQSTKQTPEQNLTPGTAYFVRYIKARIENNKNFLAVITGPTGSGKSYAGLSLMYALTGELDIDNVCLNAEDILVRINDKTKYLKPGDVLLWDEAGVDMNSKQWASVANRVINIVLQTFRHRNIIIIMTLPYFSFLDSDARKLTHCVMETQGIDRKNKTSYLKPLLIQVNQHSGKAYTKYLRVKRNTGSVVPVKAIAVKIPSKEFLVDYEKKKTRFTEELNIDALAKLRAWKEKQVTKKTKEIKKKGTDEDDETEIPNKEKGNEQ